MGLLEAIERRDFDRGVADDVDQRLVAPHVAFERGDVEVADHQSRLAQLFGPAGHPFDEVELLPELGIDGAVGDVAAGWHVDVLDPHSALEANADVARLAIVLPVVAARFVQRQAADDGDAMVHLLAVELLVDIAVLAEQLGREDLVERLGFLQAQHVGLLLGQQALDQLGAGADRVDVPRCDLDRSAHGLAPSPRRAPRKEMALAPGAWSEGRLAFVTQGILRARVTGGNPKQGAGSNPI